MTNTNRSICAKFRWKGSPGLQAGENVTAFAFFGMHVARTIGTGIVAPGLIDPAVVFAALAGAIGWNVLTWIMGIPSSSSHALVGGLVGAGLAKAGSAAIVWGGFRTIVLGIVLSPLMGMLCAIVLVVAVAWVSLRSTPFATDRRFRYLQLVSSALLSLAHGANDSQKTIGIVSILLFSQGRLGAEFHVPFWVVLMCEAAMALGTLCGGWKIVHTMGTKITRLTPVQGFCAETGGAIALFGATWLGIPVSTTHTITGSIVGTGTVRSLTAVRWIVARRIVWAWCLTIPAAAATSGICYRLVMLVPG